MARYSDLGYAGGDGMHPITGAAIGVGVGTAAAVGVRQFTTLDKWSEAIGAGAGLAASGVLWATGSRGAAGGAALATLLNNGIRFLGSMLLAKEKTRDAAGEALTSSGMAGALGIVRPQVVPTLGAQSAQVVPTLGAVSAERRHLAEAGLGLVQAEQRQLAAAQLPMFQSAMGMGAPQSPVQIVGAGGIGGNYGATIFGSR